MEIGMLTWLGRMIVKLAEALSDLGYWLSEHPVHRKWHHQIRAYDRAHVMLYRHFPGQWAAIVDDLVVKVAPEAGQAWIAGKEWVHKTTGNYDRDVMVRKIDGTMGLQQVFTGRFI